MMLRKKKKKKLKLNIWDGREIIPNYRIKIAARHIVTLMT